MVSLDAFPGEGWEGRVAEIDPAQTVIGGAVYYRATIVLSKSDPRLKAGMTADVLIRTGEALEALLIPASALSEGESGPVVRVYANGSISERAVSTGLRSRNGMIQALSGLSEGDLVVTGER